MFEKYFGASFQEKKMNSDKPSSSALYHEKQRLQLCLVHTLNALLQRNEFKKADLDCIAENLHDSKWFNRHRSMLGLGNYDVNVLIAALETKDLKMIWFDSRRSAASLDFQKIYGFIFNVPSRSTLPFFNGHHWFAVRQMGDAGFFNFDSKLNEPTLIPDFITFADSYLSNGSQMMVVLRSQNTDCYLKQ